MGMKEMKLQTDWQMKEQRNLLPEAGQEPLISAVSFYSSKNV